MKNMICFRHSLIIQMIWRAAVQVKAYSAKNRHKLTWNRLTLSVTVWIESAFICEWPVYVFHVCNVCIRCVESNRNRLFCFDGAFDMNRSTCWKWPNSIIVLYRWTIFHRYVCLLHSSILCVGIHFCMRIRRHITVREKEIIECNGNRKRPLMSILIDLQVTAFVHIFFSVDVCRCGILCWFSELISLWIDSDHIDCTQLDGVRILEID